MINGSELVKNFFNKERSDKLTEKFNKKLSKKLVKIEKQIKGKKRLIFSVAFNIQKNRASVIDVICRSGNVPGNSFKATLWHTRLSV